MFKKQAGKRGGKANETRFSNGLSSNEEPKHQNKKESVEADPRSQTLKEKIMDVDIAFSVEERRTLIKLFRRILGFYNSSNVNMHQNE